MKWEDLRLELDGWRNEKIAYRVRLEGAVGSTFWLGVEDQCETLSEEGIWERGALAWLERVFRKKFSCFELVYGGGAEELVYNIDEELEMQNVGYHILYKCKREDH